MGHVDLLEKKSGPVHKILALGACNFGICVCKMLCRQRIDLGELQGLKIAVELRYNSINNKVTFDPRWNHYVKTTFVQFRGEGWRCKEVDVPIGQINEMLEKWQKA